MKKILGLLGAVSLFTSTSGVVISCNSDSRIETASINEKLANEIIAKLTNDGGFGYTFGDLFSDTDITTAVVNKINELIGVNYNYSSTNTLLSSLGLTSYSDKTKNDFQTRFNNLLNTVGVNKLFDDYSKTVTKGTNSSLDYKLIREYYALNPIRDTIITGTDGKIYKVEAKEKIKIGGASGAVWKIAGEDSSTDTKDINVPNISELSANKFSVSAYAVEGTDENGAYKFADEKTDAVISANTALSLRFQDYFNHDIILSSLDNVLTMVYNQSSLWRVLASGNDKNAYIDITNPVFSKTQTWSANDMSTNVKMVWTYTISKDGVGGAKDKLKGILDTNNKLIKDKSITKIFEALGKDSNLDKTDGVDPYLNMSGYKGIVVSKDGTTIGTNPISGAAYESDVNNSANLTNHGGIVQKNSTLWYYTNSENSNNVDIVITLPIYMLQLLGVESLGNSESDVKDGAQNTPINYKITDANSATKDIKFQRSPSTNPADTFSAMWELNKEKLSSEDVKSIASDTTKQESLFEQIQYLISQDSTNQENAKKVMYTKYLDKDDIYFAGLFDKIGQYISSSDDEDE